MVTGSFYTFLKTLKAAFLYHWNLLYIGVFLALGLISGEPDIIYPFCTAIEIIYLAIVSSNPRFQNVVEAKNLENKSKKNTETEINEPGQIINELNFEDRRQFTALQELCMKLRQLSEGIKGNADLEPEGVNKIQLENMNRLLWIYLKLLSSKTSLEKFFNAINEKEIKGNLESTESRIKALGPVEKDDTKEAKHRRSLLDMHETLEARLKNYQNAKENYDFIQLELERLYSKISGIVEMSINHQDANLVSTEIDVVTSSVMQTEKTMQDIKSITGFSFEDEKPPALLKNVKSVRMKNKKDYN